MGMTAYSSDPNVPIARNFAAYHAANPGIVDNGWVRSFGSPVLVSLVNEAIANSPDLRAASFRVEEARALARQAGADVFPTLSAGLSTEDRGLVETGGVEPDDDVQARLDVSWEADIWGRVRGQRAAAYLDAAAEVAVFEGVRQALAAEVARAWIQVTGDAYRLRLARDELGVRTRILRNVEERIAAQTLVAVDGNLVRADVARTRSDVAAAEGNLARSARALEVLLGRYPSAELKDLGGLPGMPGAVPVGLPAQLLERRPDLVARERQVAAAFNREREARAARLPTLTLDASLVGEEGNLGDALDPANIIWSVAGGVFAPLIDGGARAEQVKVTSARQKTALAEYGTAALRAFQEVENALSDEQVLSRREAQLGRAVSEFREASGLEQERYEAGEVDLIRVEDALLRFYDSQSALADVRIARLLNRVNLHLALGGSFDEQPAVQQPESDAESSDT